MNNIKYNFGVRRKVDLKLNDLLAYFKTRDIFLLHTRRDLNPQPSDPKSDALSN